MGRVRFIGTSPFDAVLPVYTDVEPRYALLPIPGIQSTPLPSIALRYPIVCDPSTMAALFGLYREYTVTVDWTIENDQAGSITTQVGSAELIFRSSATSELGIWEDDPGFVPPIAFVSGTSDYTNSYSSGAPDDVFNDVLGGSGAGIGLLDGNIVAPPFPYYYDPVAETFLPHVTVALGILSTVGPSIIAVDNTLDAAGSSAYNGPGEASGVNETMSFLGSSAPVGVAFGLTVGTNTLVSFSMNVSVTEWWPYTGAEGACWNTATGAVVNPHDLETD